MAFRDPDKPDQTFDALNSVCKAAVAQVKRLENVESDTLIPFAWPTIVINAPLFECYLRRHRAAACGAARKRHANMEKPMIPARHTFVQVYTSDKFVADSPALHAAATEFVTLAAAENDRAPRVPGGE